MTHIQYGPVAVVASRREQIVVIFLAVRLSFPLEEVPGADLLLTVCTHKVLRVPGTAHGSHHLSEQESRWRIETCLDQLFRELYKHCKKTQSPEVILVQVLEKITWHT